MRGTVWTGLALASALSLPAAAHGSDHGYGHGYGYGYGHRDSLSWAIVSSDLNTMTNLDEMGSLDEMKEKYGDEFLYIRLGDERYVIQDKVLLKRAQDAAKPMQEAGRELGAAVGAQVREAMGSSHHWHEQGELIREQARLTRQIVRRSMRGESTDDLEQEQERVSRELQKLSNERDQDTEKDHADRKERSADTQAATKRLQEAARHVHEEMRAILREAKSRNLAKRID